MTDEDRCAKCRENLMYGASGLAMGACLVCTPQIVLCGACYNEHLIQKHGAPKGFDAEAEYKSLD